MTDTAALLARLEAQAKDRDRSAAKMRRHHLPGHAEATEAEAADLRAVVALVKAMTPK